MARRASGSDEALAHAYDLIAQATDVEQLRQAQAVVLPLAFGLDMQSTARAIGVSKGWACQLRTRFLRGQVVGAPQAQKPGGRRHENMTASQEHAFLAPFFEQAAEGGVLVVGLIKRALDERLGRRVPLSSVYNLLHRNGWRKLAPDKRHPQSDPLAQEAWKKNSPTSSTASAKPGRKTNRSS